MRLLHDSFFYHSNARSGAASDLQNEKKLIAEEQKVCQARARKFCLETKRRRKASEDRQKQRDEKEEQARETILQQRRERVQEATERFQRGHLPPSQRRRRTFTKDVPNIEDALSQLQGPVGGNTQQLSYLSRNHNINRNCNPSLQSTHGQALSVVEVQTKMLLEERMTFSKNSIEDDETQEKQQNYSPQDSHVSDVCKDSLENEDNNNAGDNLWNSRFYLFDSQKPPHTSDLTSSAMRLPDGNLARSQKQQEPQQKTQDESEGPNNKMHIFNAPWGFRSEQTQKPETQPAVNGDNQANSTRNNARDNINFVNTVTPDSTALDSSCPKPEAPLDLRQQRVHDDRPFVHPSATEILLPAKNGNGKEISSGAPPKPNIFLYDSNIDNSSRYGTLWHTGKENHHLSSQKEPSASYINFNKFLYPEPVLQHARPSNIQADALKCFKHPEEGEGKLPLSLGEPRSTCNVRFLKGILKKTSRYESGDSACVHGSGREIFAEQVALAIKDSVELIRVKMNKVKCNPTKKKVHWFDEVYEVKEQNKYRSAIPSQSKKNPEDHQQSLAPVPGAPKPGPSVTPAASTGYHFTKQAWADVGVQVSLPRDRAEEVKVLQNATRSTGPKAPWRESSARARAAPVSSGARKGTVIRPQSATELNRIAKTQGRTMVPRPPPRMEAVEEEKMAYVAKAPYGVDHTCGVNSKHAGAGEPAQRRDASGGSHHVIRTDSGVVHTPLPPPYTCPGSEGMAKSKLSSGHQETPRRRGTVSNERALCLDFTPTDEEISQLWHGVRSALAIKDVDPKTFLPYNGPLSAAPRAQANNLSHVAISSVAVLSATKKLAPRFKAPESGRVFRKPCSEQCRQSPGSGNRRPPPPQTCQPSKQSTEPGRMFPNTCNVALTHEAQLHLAEGHAAGRLEEREMVAAMETAQTQGFTTISLEEQKVLLSLEKLDHRLHRVQKNTRCLGLTDAACTKEMKVTNHHKPRASSANVPLWYLKKS
ncbi:centrosomal protein of 126 kDa [Limanda limanda]|uniref:centrosomal protein of 126 kDa n=1 Tax=Limanda limanda TaxID=27771 RepID=UPI0029C7E72C|nr:centrosomal protein of 126 kDa [Limanda limanda]